MLVTFATLALVPGCDSAVDPGGDDSGSSSGTSSGADAGGTSEDSRAMTGAPPFTTSPTNPPTATATSPNPPTATAAVTTDVTFGTGSSSFGSSESGVGPQSCGNGAVDFAEQCDGEDLFGFSCEGLGLGEGVLTCSEACLFDTTGCMAPVPDCGDGLVQPGEQCDQIDLQGFNCGSLGLGSGVLACSLECTFDTSGCTDVAGCGDGVVAPGEQCDGADLQGLSCTDLGLGVGALGCDPVQCTFDTSGCSF